jgi:hypothetical protein
VLAAGLDPGFGLRPWRVDHQRRSAAFRQHDRFIEKGGPITRAWMDEDQAGEWAVARWDDPIGVDPAVSGTGVADVMHRDTRLALDAALLNGEGKRTVVVKYRHVEFLCGRSQRSPLFVFELDESPDPS